MPEDYQNETYSTLPLDMRFYPDEDWYIVPLLRTPRSTADLSDDELSRCLIDEDSGVVARAVALIQLIRCEALSDRALHAVQTAYESGPFSLKMFVIHILSSFLRQSRERSEFRLSGDRQLQSLIDTLAAETDYRLQPGCWCTRSGLGDPTVGADAERVVQSYNWRYAAKLVTQLQHGEVPQAPWTIEKPRNVTRILFTLPNFHFPRIVGPIGEYVVSKRFADVGETIDPEQVIVELESAEFIMGLPAFVAGTIAEWHVETGDTADVGQPLFTLSTNDG